MLRLAQAFRRCSSLRCIPNSSNGENRSKATNLLRARIQHAVVELKPTMRTPWSCADANDPSRVRRIASEEAPQRERMKQALVFRFERIRPQPAKDSYQLDRALQIHNARTARLGLLRTNLTRHRVQRARPHRTFRPPARENEGSNVVESQRRPRRALQAAARHLRGQVDALCSEGAIGRI